MRGNVECAMQHVLTDEALAEHFRGVAVGVEAGQVDLPEPLVALDVSHAAISVGDRRRVDVRDAEIVPADVERAVAVGDVEGSVHWAVCLVPGFGGLLR